jgi:hypothetical protein
MINGNFLTFRFDQTLSQHLRKILDAVIGNYKDAQVLNVNDNTPIDKDNLIIDFISESSLSQTFNILPHIRICLLDKNQGLFSYGQNIEQSNVDAVIDESIDFKQLQTLIGPIINQKNLRREEEFSIVGIKNLRKFENEIKQITQKELSKKFQTSAEDLLSYTQALVNLEKELIHAEDLSRMAKILRQFAKNNFDRAKFNFITDSQLWDVELTANFLLLPRFRGEFIGVEFQWRDDDFFNCIKKLFFFLTIVNFFSSKQNGDDPFSVDKLWESALDGIPFPVVLMSTKGEVYQHNLLFSKLNLAPADCCKLQLREKISINDIPYNVFRKEIHHLDEDKILFVLFTESFFLKGDGHLNPSGQELGIITSSIAHELNNPIAGIQAALTLLMLDEELNDEIRDILLEMKNGATRCKQLVETFLGFSRADPRALLNVEANINAVEICYQQAQNLLRFRTVESGIRFAFTFSRHSEFRASVNLSLLTMTFYLIMGEVMTLYSHHLLISDKNQIDKVIRGDLIESSQEIHVQLHELNISSLSLSKLIQNLLTIENFVLQASDYSLRFIYNPPKDVD